MALAGITGTASPTAITPIIITVITSITPIATGMAVIMVITDSRQVWCQLFHFFRVEVATKKRLAKQVG